MVRQTVLSGFVIGIAGFLAWRYFLNTLGMSEFAARNSLLLLMVFFENYHALNCRSERKSIFARPLFSNKFLVGAIILAQGLHILSLYMPVMQNVLSVEPVSFYQWLATLILGAVILLVMELYKAIIKKLRSA